MKKLILLFILFISSCAFAQKHKGIVYYGFINALQRGYQKGDDSNAYMVFNNEQSYYVTAKDSLERAERINEQKIDIDEDGKGGAISLGLKVSPHGDQVVYHVRKNTMWSNLLYGSQVYVKEIAPRMNWKIEKETKKIGSFQCKKATTKFRGRSYTAWFTIDIAVPFGPWKLNGLPGLILEAYDTDKFVSWYFKSVEYPTKNKETVKYISTTKGAKFTDYEGFKLFQEEQQNRAIEKNRIVGKQFPNVIFGDPKLPAMFIEFE